LGGTLSTAGPSGGSQDTTGSGGYITIIPII
jgi:hypothetical protein